MGEGLAPLPFYRKLWAIWGLGMKLLTVFLVTIHLVVWKCAEGASHGPHCEDTVLHRAIHSGSEDVLVGKLLQLTWCWWQLKIIDDDGGCADG